MYNTEARVSELDGLRVSDVVLDGSACIDINGEGRKQRTVPLWRVRPICFEHGSVKSGMPRGLERFSLIGMGLQWTGQT